MNTSNQIILTHEDGFNFQLPVMKGILSYKGNLYHGDHELPHPGALINTSWRDLRSAIERFIIAYNQYDNAARPYLVTKGGYHDPKDGPNITNVSALYRTVIYEATELIENLTNNLKLCFVSKKDWNLWSPGLLNRWKDHPTIACNKLKHNHNTVVSVQAVLNLGVVRGYCICYHSDDALKVNSKIHPKKNPFAYGTDIRRILSHIYLISFAIHNHLLKMFPENFDFDKVAPDKSDIEFLKLVSEFMPLSFPHYTKSSELPIFKFKDRSLYIADTGGFVFPYAGNARMAMMFSGDGYTRSFPII